MSVFGNKKSNNKQDKRYKGCVKMLLPKFSQPIRRIYMPHFKPLVLNRTQEVQKLLKQGLGRKEVADALGIEVKNLSKIIRRYGLDCE